MDALPNLDQFTVNLCYTETEYLLLITGPYLFSCFSSAVGINLLSMNSFVMSFPW